MTPFPRVPSPLGDTRVLGAVGGPSHLQPCPARPASREPLSRAAHTSQRGREPGFALGEQDGDSGLRGDPFLRKMNAFASGCPCFLRGSQDMCKRPLRALIYMAGAEPTESRISLFTAGQRGSLPLSALRIINLGPEQAGRLHLLPLTCPVARLKSISSGFFHFPPNSVNILTNPSTVSTGGGFQETGRALHAPAC